MNRYCLQSLSGHTSPVDAVKFNCFEDTVIAGSLSGALKIWDLESIKSKAVFVGCFICKKKMFVKRWLVFSDCCRFILWLQSTGTLIDDCFPCSPCSLASMQCRMFASDNVRSHV